MPHMNNMNIKIIQSIVFALVFILLTTDSVAAEAKQSFVPYCGVRCLYGAMRFTGHKTSFDEFLTPKYIGSADGSTLDQLRQAAEDKGIYSLPVQNLSIKDLTTYKPPIILHTKRHLSDKEFNHWMLFVGIDHDKAMIIDAPNPLRRVSMDEMSLLCDGVGLVVSSQPVKLADIQKSFYFRYVVTALLVVGAVYFCRRLDHFLKRLLGNAKFQNVLVQMAVFTGLTSCIIAVASAVDFGVLSNSSSINMVQRIHAASFLHKVELSELDAAINNNAILIDARYYADYTGGHIAGALNIPINLPQEDRHKTLFGIDKNKEIIVYCQSRGCDFAKIIATALLDDGFKNIKLLNGGWLEWSKVMAIPERHQ